MSHVFEGEPGGPCMLGWQRGDTCLLADDDPIHFASLPFDYEPTPANPAAPPPRKCRRHDWVRNADWNGGPSDTAIIQCARCNATKDPIASRRGRNNKNRGNAIERELGKKLGMQRVGQFGGPDDLSNVLFAAQVKSGGYFSERQWAWLKAVPVKAGQTALLVVADTPGPGKRRRAVVILDLDDWRDLHGEAE